MTEGTTLRQAGAGMHCRPMRESDLPLIINSWLLSCHRPFSHGQDFFDCHTPVVRHLLSTARVLVACDPNSEDTIQGWICFDQRPDGVAVVHFVYTKFVFQRNGIATTLLGEAMKMVNPANGPVANNKQPVLVACSHINADFKAYKEKLASNNGSALGALAWTLFYDPHSILLRNEKP